MRKNIQTAPTRSNCKHIKPCSSFIQINRKVFSAPSPDPTTPEKFSYTELFWDGRVEQWRWVYVTKVQLHRDFEVTFKTAVWYASINSYVDNVMNEIVTVDKFFSEILLSAWH